MTIVVVFSCDAYCCGIGQVNRNALRTIGVNFSITNDNGIKVFQQLAGAATIGAGNLPTMLDNGQAFASCEAAVVSLAGGSDLTMAEVNRVMDQVRTRCDSVQVLMGAGIDQA